MTGLPNILSFFVAAVVVAGSSLDARAQVSPTDLDAAAKLFTDGQFAEAAEASDKLIGRLGPDQLSLRPTLTFNRGCALLAAKQPDKAVEALLSVDSQATDPALRAAARYNLGQIAAQQAEPLAEKERDKAIEAYRRAERFFRNALPDQPADKRADTAKNIEAIQRRIAKLLEEQKKDDQQQQQDQQKQDQKDQQDKKDQDQKQQDQKDGKDQQDKKDQKDQKSDNKDQSKQDKTGDKGQDQKDGKPGEDQQEPKPGEEKKDPSADPKDTEKQKQEAEKQKQAAGADQDAKQVEVKPGDKREFDRAAAEILDKEKKQRERIRQMMQMMRRAAPVERDW